MPTDLDPAEGMVTIRESSLVGDSRGATALPARSPAFQAFKRGVQQERAKRWDSAREAYAEARRHLPTFLEAWFGEARACEQLERWPEAFTAYREIVRQDATNLPALCNLALLCKQRGDRNEAIRLNRRALLYDPGFLHIVVNHVALCCEDEAWDEAERILRAGLKQNPSAGQMHFALGFVLLRTGRTDAAVAAYREAARLQPQHAAAWQNLGRALERAGNREEAVDAYRQAHRLEPKWGTALLGYGNVLFKTGRHEEALRILRRARRLDPNHPALHAALGLVLHATGDRTAARESYDRAAELQSDLPDPYFGRANLEFDEGNYDLALAGYEQAATLDPTFLEAYFNAGICLDLLGRRAEANHQYRRALQEDADYVDAGFNLAVNLALLGEREAAIAQYEENVRRHPEHAMSWFNVGVIHMDREAWGDARRCFAEAWEASPEMEAAAYNLAMSCAADDDPEAAAAAYEELLVSNPRHLDALINYGIHQYQAGDLTAAQELLERAREVSPETPNASYNLGMVLDAQGHRREALKHFEETLANHPEFYQAATNAAVILNAMGRSQEAVRYARRALSLRRESPLARSNLLVYLQYLPEASNAELYEAACAWCRAERALVPAVGTFGPERRQPRARLRIGYVSPDFREHSVSFFFLPLLEHHDRERYEIFCYSNVAKPDAVTARTQSLCDQWRDITRLDDEAVAAQVRSDGIDILVDLAGHYGGNRLGVFARRPAPVQVTWLGYANTTGLDTIDYRLTDAIADPEGESDRWNREQLWRLPGHFLCYQPPSEEVEVQPGPVGRGEPFTFGSFNNLAKLNGEVIALWAELLREAPAARLLLKSVMLVHPEEGAAIHEQFARHGVDPARVELMGVKSGLAAHLATYHRVDVALDPFPYNGTTTTYEALWMGVPVITLVGNRHAARVGASILRQLHLDELVAQNPTDYLAKALALYQNPDLLGRIRPGLRPLLLASSLCDAPAFASDIEDAFRGMWRRYCAQSDRKETLAMAANDR